ncbi:MAG: DNA-3-methyladenine glycosylase [Streptosporangiales bacterium]
MLDAQDGEPAGGLLPRGFFAGSSLAVAPRLLGCVLEHATGEGLVAVALTEVEAYNGSADPASHAYRGRTGRNAVMFGGPGHAYVYFTYGMHFCVNLVCRPEGTASAVLLRAGRVIEGIPLAAARRAAGRIGAGRRAGGPGDPGGPADRGQPTAVAAPGVLSPAVERELARGPARLCQALGIERGLDGADVCDPGSPLRIRPAPEVGSGRPVPEISHGPRVGISAAADRPWRFWLTGDPTVSAYRPYARRARPEVISPPAGEDGTMHR